MIIMLLLKFASIYEQLATFVSEACVLGTCGSVKKD